MSSLLLNGNQEYLVDDTPALRQEIERLVGKLRQTEGALRQAQDEARVQAASISSLRKQLSPLYRALQGVFGELESFNLDGSEPNPTASDKWEFWKKRFVGRGAELIDVLLINKSMNTKQLSTALKCDPRTLAQLIYKLNQAGIISKNGNMFSLKDLG